MSLVAAIIALSLHSKPVICIDPGHPSEVGNGTKGKFVTEIDVVWSVANALKPKLLSDGYSVVFTKKSARQMVTNKARAEIANRSRASLLLRIHCDHAIGHSGFATIFADRTGKMGKFSGPPPAVLKQIEDLGPKFHRAAINFLNGKLEDRGIIRESRTNVGSRYGALIGTIHSKVPAILVEVCVLSNAKDESFVRTAAGIEAIAGALQEGVRKTVPIRG